MDLKEICPLCFCVPCVCPDGGVAGMQLKAKREAEALAYQRKLEILAAGHVSGLTGGQNPNPPTDHK